MTIESRQPAATLDPEQATAWIDVAVSLVRHALETPDIQYAAVCVGEFQSSDICSLDLLTTIGCSRPTIEYYSRQLSMSPNSAKHAAETTSRKLRRLDLFRADDQFRQLMTYHLSLKQMLYDQSKARQRLVGSSFEAATASKAITHSTS